MLGDVHSGMFGVIEVLHRATGDPLTRPGALDRTTDLPRY